MIAKLLILMIALAVAGCGAAKKPKPLAVAPQPETTQRMPAGAAQPAADSLKHKIIEAAKEEWIFFGQQKVVVEQDEESIPHVGIWEDDDWPHIDRVNQYWRAVGKPRLSGTDCKEPWSAAFISWVMQTAGVPASQFPPAIAHKSYLSHFLAQADNPGAGLLPHTITEYRPQPGDLICANRGRGYFGDVVEDLPQSLNAKLHCDIVVQTDGKTLQAIGGNVRNSVSKTILTLNPQGYLQLSSHRPWFLVIENRLE